jgi:alanyl-tRNA synthetase
MTERLYYVDPACREFDATVAAVQPAPDPNTLHVRLDRTAFYPTSGGQPFDTGALSGCRVVDVVDEDNGDVTHVVRRPGPSDVRRPGPLDPADQADPIGSALHVGARVHGAIDWERRFDHMQQHTGQHVLSAALVRLFDAATVGFHLGAEVSTIDLSREQTPRDLAAAEDEANRIVWEDRPVGIRFASAEEAARLPLRKEPVRTGTLRLIEIDDFDLSACGGTHVARTGQIGLIGITGWERFKGGQRLEFRCGRRALLHMRLLRDQISAGSRLLSVPGHDLADAIARLQSEAKEQRRNVAALQTELLGHRADQLATAPEMTARGKAIFKAIDGDANTLKALAALSVARGGLVAVLVSTARPCLAIVARSLDVQVAANEILSELTAKFGGRGGGKSDLAQGGGLDAPAEAILDEARRVLQASD